MKTSLSDPIKARALEARNTALRQKAVEDAKTFRQLLAQICQVLGPVEIHLQETRVWAEIDGRRYTLVRSSLALVLDKENLDNCIAFSSLEHLGELLSVEAEVRAQVTLAVEPVERRSWWRFW